MLTLFGIMLLQHATNDDEPSAGITKTTLKDTTKNVGAYLNNDDMMALKQMPLKAKSQTTTTYKTTLESVRKLQQKEKPVEITAAAAKLYNSYDGSQTRVAKKPNTNHNNNNEKQQQQQYAATLTTSFLSAPPDVSKHNNDVLQQQLQQMQQQQRQNIPQQQQKLAQTINACNDKLTRNISSNSNSTSNANANVTVKRVNFDLPQKVDSEVAAARVEPPNREFLPPQPPASVASFSTQASSNSSSISISGSRNSSNSHTSSRAAAFGIESDSSEILTNSASASNSSTTPLAGNAQAPKTLATYQRSSSVSTNDTSKPLTVPNYARKVSSRAELARTHLSPYKQIVYNGTYPIDLPLQSRFEALGRDYDPEANAQTTRLKYTHILNDYDLDEHDLLDDVAEEDEDDDDYVDDDDVDAYDYNEADELEFDQVDERMSYDMATLLAEQGRPERGTLLNRMGVIREVSTSNSVSQAGGNAAGAGDAVTTTSNHHAVWSMQELIANPAIPLNYRKMCHEVEQSLTSFEKYLDSKTFEQRKSQQQPVRTYDIDGPIGELHDKKHI